MSRLRGQGPCCKCGGLMKGLSLDLELSFPPSRSTWREVGHHSAAPMRRRAGDAGPARLLPPRLFRRATDLFTAFWAKRRGVPRRNMTRCFVLHAVSELERVLSDHRPSSRKGRCSSSFDGPGARQDECLRKQCLLFGIDEATYEAMCGSIWLLCPSRYRQSGDVEAKSSGLQTPNLLIPTRAIERPEE